MCRRFIITRRVDLNDPEHEADHQAGNSQGAEWLDESVVATGPADWLDEAGIATATEGWSMRAQPLLLCPDLVDMASISRRGHADHPGLCAG